MSDRQIARAATSGRSLTFGFIGAESLTGYVVGMDDFHWLVAHHTETSKPTISLVHKGSAALITISPESDLLDSGIKPFVERIGRGFFDFCTTTFLPPASSTLEKAS